MTSAPPSGSDEPSCVLQALHADKSADAHVELYADDHPNHPAEPNENAMPDLAPTTAPGPDHVELVVDGEKFVVHPTYRLRYLRPDLGPCVVRVKHGKQR
jgi:hypothetical protein